MPFGNPAGYAEPAPGGVPQLMQIMQQLQGFLPFRQKPGFGGLGQQPAMPVNKIDQGWLPGSIPNVQDIVAQLQPPAPGLNRQGFGEVVPGFNPYAPSPNQQVSIAGFAPQPMPQPPMQLQPSTPFQGPPPPQLSFMPSEGLQAPAPPPPMTSTIGPAVAPPVAQPVARPMPAPQPGGLGTPDPYLLQLMASGKTF